jgi:hypothetical protein
MIHYFDIFVEQCSAQKCIFADFYTFHIHTSEDLETLEELKCPILILQGLDTSNGLK